MRITEKKENGFYELKEDEEIYGEENGIRLVQIVGQLEDIKEKHSILSLDDLDSRLTALETIKDNFNFRFSEHLDGEYEIVAFIKNHSDFKSYIILYRGNNKEQYNLLKEVFNNER